MKNSTADVLAIGKDLFLVQFQDGQTAIMRRVKVLTRKHRKKSKNKND